MSIAVSIFISQDGDKISIKSLAADDAVSKAVERMLTEQAADVLLFVDAAATCAASIKESAGIAMPKPPPHAGQSKAADLPKET